MTLINLVETFIPHTVSKYPRAHTSENSCLLTALASAEIHKTGTGPERAQAIDRCRGRENKKKERMNIRKAALLHKLLCCLYEESLVVSAVVMSTVCL